MNRVVLFEQDQISPLLFSLRDSFRVEHLTNHLKISVEDELKVAVINKGLCVAKVKKIGRTEIILQISDALEAPQHNQLTMVIATSRPPTLKKIVEHASTLGVSHFHFFTAQLSEKSYLKSKVLALPKLNELATLGVSQSGQLWKLPTFTFSNHLNEAIEKTIGQKYILSLRQGKTLAQQDLNFESPLNFFIGPERGWTTKEEQLLINRKVQPIVLSQHILRVETACFALLSQLEMLKLNC